MSTNLGLRNYGRRPHQSHHQPQHPHLGYGGATKHHHHQHGSSGYSGARFANITGNHISDLRSPRPRRKNNSADDEDRNKNFKVVIRVRPPLPRELNGIKPFQNVTGVDERAKTITISENLAAHSQHGAGMIESLTLDTGNSYQTYTGPYSTHRFTFDHVYDQNCSQQTVYDNTAKGVVDFSLEGYNATIFAYGQTGTGKTYTMEGFKGYQALEERGIIPRAIEQIFMHIKNSVSPRMRFLVRASYLQIYNEVINDLLKPDRTNLIIREDKRKGVFVEGLSEWVVRTPQEIYGLMERGGARRATGSTKMNEMSSRSHAVFIIIAEQSETMYVDKDGNLLPPEAVDTLLNSAKSEDNVNANIKQSFKVGKLNLVDLAGSERVRLTGATGQRLEESKKINQSLSALGNVIAALTDVRGRQHIPYRDSKLTRILEDSLGGNCKTTMMAMISPALEAYTESLSTLKFANRAKNIKNEATINEDLDQKSLLRKYEREVKVLRSQLAARNRNIIDQRRFLELDEQRRRAEEDKMAAIRALEERSLQFMREKQMKKQLEERLRTLQGQMIIGGNPDNLQQTSAFRAALKEQRDRIRGEYDAKLKAIEREREGIEEERAQVDRYKQLLLKQRDIMIALTQRLNERDEQIMALQDELDAYDRHQKELEEKLDEKTAALIHLQRVTIEHNAKSPEKNNELVKALGDWGEREAAAAAAAAARQKRQQHEGEEPALGVQKNDDSIQNESGGVRCMETPIRYGGRRGGGDGRSVIRMALSSQKNQGGSQQQPPIQQTPQHPHQVSRDEMLLVSPQLLITHKQYESLEKSRGGQSIVFSSSVTPSREQGKKVLLSAEEKITELLGTVDRMNGDCQKLRRDLEETQAEKVSMEYLLREKLERLVQNEIEDRLQADRRMQQSMIKGVSSAGAAHGKTNEDITRLQIELEAARADRANANDEIKQLKRKCDALSKTSLGNAASVKMSERIKALTMQHGAYRTEMAARLEERNTQVKSLRKEVSALRIRLDHQRNSATENENGHIAHSSNHPQHDQSPTSSQRDPHNIKKFRDIEKRCAIHERERQAIETIMEHKVKRLTDSIVSLVSRGVAAAGGGEGKGEGVTSETIKHIRKEANTLQKLVDAAVTALHNSEVGSSSFGTGSHSSAGGSAKKN